MFHLFRSRDDDDGDRRKQLRKFAKLSSQLDELFERGGDPGAADYRRIADRARDLLASGFDHEQLKALAFSVPPSPDWTNPKAIDNGLAVEPWQIKAAGIREELSAVALDLRALGQY
jgi:hypothetical protein